MVAPSTNPVTFDGVSPPWDLTSLDANFAALNAAVSTVANFSNYLVDTGAASAYVVTFPGTVSFGLTAGILVAFKATNASTGSSTLNVNGTGAKNLINPDGTATTASQIPASGIVLAIYDGTSFQILSITGKPNAGRWSLINTYTPSAVASQSITGFNSVLYKDYMVITEQLKPASNNVGLLMQTSTDGGSNFDGGAGNYDWAASYILVGTGVSGTGSNSATEIGLSASVGCGNGTNDFFDGRITIQNPGATAFCNLFWQATFNNSVDAKISINGGARRLASADVDALKIYFNGANIASGTIRFYGLTL
jgi:hypothetical protein